jgi:hypothetical protein
VWERLTIHKILSVILKGKDHMKELVEDEKILEWILEK